jgi:spoIIIJ-associated protein
MPDKNQIKETIKEFFGKMTFDVEVEVNDFEEDDKSISIPVSIKAENPEKIIGYKGEVLNSAQFILKAILKKQIESDKRIYLNLDVNNYKQKKIDYIKELASSAADDVALIRVPKTLEPMTGEERRAIHMELEDRSDVVTESIGERDNRRVVIKPAN